MSTLLRSESIRAATVRVRGAEIHAGITVPEDATGLVILAYPTGSSWANPKHQHVAAILNDAGLATVFCDLLTTEEELLSDITGEFRHDVALLSVRLTAIADWCRLQPDLRDLDIGLLGVGAGAAAAFITAANRPQTVRSLVVRGGRLDLAWTSLRRIHIPVLLIAGEHDVALRSAYEVCFPHIASPQKEIAIIARAGALFSEPMMLFQYAEHAALWFRDHLEPRGAVRVGWRPETS